MHWAGRSTVEEAGSGGGDGFPAGTGRGADVGSGAGAVDVFEEGSVWVFGYAIIVRGLELHYSALLSRERERERERERKRKVQSLQLQLQQVQKNYDDKK